LYSRSQLSEQHLDRSSRAQLTRVPNSQTHIEYRHTDTLTTLHATSVALGRIFARPAGDTA